MGRTLIRGVRGFYVVGRGEGRLGILEDSLVNHYGIRLDKFRRTTLPMEMMGKVGWDLALNS